VTQILGHNIYRIDQLLPRRSVKNGSVRGRPIWLTKTNNSHFRGLLY